MAKLSRIAPEIPVANLSDSLGYYERQLGFKVVIEMPERDYAIVERDDIAIHLFQQSRAHSRVGIHVFTDKLEELHAELEKRGAHLTQGIEMKPWGNRDFRIHDLSHNEIKFTEPRD